MFIIYASDEANDLDISTYNSNSREKQWFMFPMSKFAAKAYFKCAYDTNVKYLNIMDNPNYVLA